MLKQPRALLMDLHAAAVAAVNGRDAVSNALVAKPLRPGPVILIAIGKAAAAMAHGALDAVGNQVERGLVITREHYADPTLPQRASIEQLETAHPVPDARSLAAGEQLVEFLADAPKQAQLLFLISGGASSLVERLPAGATPEGLAELNDALLASGLDIGRMNRVRKAFSTIKGGRLTGWLAGRPTRVLLISDVPGDDPGVIGSGLLFPDEQGPPPAEQLAELGIEMAPAPAPPAGHDPVFASIDWQIVASNKSALDAAEAAASAAGVAVTRHAEFLEGDAVACGQRIAHTLLHDGSPGIHLWGGEPTVNLPPQPGRGGRMQTLALAAACELPGSDRVLLAAGTDGADGPGEDAGAVVDGETLVRGTDAGLNAEVHLAKADSGSFLAAANALVQTGYTGTNVMDVVIGWCPAADV